MALDLHCHFDTGNQADSREYDHVTLTAVSGVPKQWEKLEEEWTARYAKHGIAYFHATEHKSYPELMEDFASAAHENTLRRGPTKSDFRHGLYPYSATLPLHDFNRARDVNPDAPRNADEILLREVIYRCVEWGRSPLISAKNYHMVFDGDEPARGILWDIHKSPGALREYPFLKDWDITSANMRRRPGLQMADLFAFSHANRAQYNGERWHQMVMGIEQDCHYFTYEELVNPHIPAIKKRDLWKLNKRAHTK